MPGTDYKLFGIRRAVAWARMPDKTLAAALTATATTLSVGTGEGQAFADAAPSWPHRVRLDDEVLYVVGVNGDTLTVERGRDGTTAAAHTQGIAVRHLHPIRLPKASQFTMDANIQTIEFPGDGDVERVFESDGVSGTLTLSKYSTRLLTHAAGVAAVTSGLPTGETERYYPELGSYPFVELWIDLKAQNEQTGATQTLRCLVFQVKLQRPTMLGDAGNNAAQTTTLAWSSQAVSQDLLGRPLPGATADVHYAYAVLQ